MADVTRVTDPAGAPPTVAVLLPCHDEAAYLPPLLATLVPQIAAQPGWRLVAVNDSSTDATGDLLDAAAAAADPGTVRVIHGRFGSPGGARTAAASSVTVLAHGAQPDWLLTIDCDVELPDDFVSGWAARFAEVQADEGVGALNGDEHQGHLLAPFPNARRAGAAFGIAANRAEAAVGITNLNGVNHAVRTVAYLTAGPYLQPTLLGPDGVVNLAGEDWDLGVRLRLAGFRIEPCPVAVRDRGRRLLADVLAYLSGEAYEGAFRRVHGDTPQDIDASLIDGIMDGTVDRVLLHFFCKPLLAQPELLGDLDDIDDIDGTGAARRLGLAPDTVASMRAWIARWPHPTFAESRHGFVYGRLARFTAAHVPAIRRDLGLTAADLAHA